MGRPSSYWHQKSLLIAGFFFSINIVASVLACAVWDLHAHPAIHNLLYIGGLLCSFLLNSLIALALYFGVRHQKPTLMMPYLVSATIHLIFSLGAAFLCLISLLDHMFAGNDSADLYGVIGFSVLFIFWLVTLHIVARERDEIRQLNGHQRLVPEYL
ncbi:unnamed protein product, partial [Mesorhabditis spiculigera]